MSRLGVSPRAVDINKQGGGVDSWFRTVGDRFNVYSGTANPTTGQVPQGQWIIYHNSTLGETRIWANVGGTLIKTAALT